jgi:hypothetical protein
MTNKKTTEVVAEIVELLTPLTPEERTRAIKASIVLLGHGIPDGEVHAGVGVAVSRLGPDDELSGVSPRASSWMKQGGVSQQDLQQVFHLEKGSAEVIAAIPGKNKREQTYNAYVLIGLARLLSSGSATFDDKSARALCESAGCYDKANHSVTINHRGNEFTGSKEKGWSLTAPGLKRAAVLVKEITKV